MIVVVGSMVIMTGVVVEVVFVKVVVVVNGHRHWFPVISLNLSNGNHRWMCNSARRCLWKEDNKGNYDRTNFKP